MWSSEWWWRRRRWVKITEAGPELLILGAHGRPAESSKHSNAPLGNCDLPSSPAKEKTTRIYGTKNMLWPKVNELNFVRASLHQMLWILPFYCFCFPPRTPPPNNVQWEASASQRWMESSQLLTLRSWKKIFSPKATALPPLPSVIWLECLLISPAPTWIIFSTEFWSLYTRSLFN